MSKISELSDGGSLLPTDFLIAVRSGGNVKVQADQTEFDRIRLGDNEKIELGNSQDLQIYHSGTSSFITENGTGDLRVGANNLLLRSDDTFVQSEDGTVNAARFNSTTGVTLYRAGAAKLATTSSGIDVTGAATFSSNIATTAGNISLGQTTAFPTTGFISHTNNYLYALGGSNGIILKDASSTTEMMKLTPSEIAVNDDSLDMDFRVESNDNANMLFVDGGNNRVGIGKAAASNQFEVGVYAQFDTGMVVNEGGNDSDFRVESNDNTHLLFVDGTQNRLAVNNSNPKRLVDIYDGTLPVLRLTNGRNEVAGSDYDLGKIEFFSRDSSGTGQRVLTEINAIADAGSTAPGGILTINTAASNDIARERIRFDSNNEVIINENSYDTDFRVESDSNSHMLFVDGGNNAVGIGTSTPGAYYAGAEQLVVAKASGEGGITIATASDTSGALYFADGTSGAQAYQGGIGYGHSTSRLFLVEGGVANVFLGPTEYVFNESGADRDFRVESDNQSHALFVNAGDGEVSVNTNDINACFGVLQKDDGNSGDIAIRMVSYTNEQDVVLRYQGRDNSGINRYADIVADFDGGNERLQFKAPYNTTSPQLELSSSDGAVFNEGSGDRDFRVESNNNSNALFVDAGNDNVTFGNEEIIHNSVEIYRQQFAITANTNTRLRLSLTNYTQVYVRVAGLRTNGSNSISYWEGYINENDNIGYDHPINTRTSGGTISYTFTNNGDGTYDWDFNNAGSGGTGTVFCEVVTGTVSISATTY